MKSIIMFSLATAFLACLLVREVTSELNQCMVEETFTVLEGFVPGRFSGNADDLRKINLLSSNFTAEVVNSTAAPRTNFSSDTITAINDLRQKIDADQTSTTAKKRRRRSTSTTTNFCYNRGDTIDGRVVMCSMCSQTTFLGFNHHPPFINEIVCQSDNGCMMNEGCCVHNVISLSFKRDLYHQNPGNMAAWETYQQSLRVSCECKLYSGSVFSLYVAY